METISSLLSDSLLSKNTAGIIIEYLTDLPKLPYIDELFFRSFLKRGRNMCRKNTNHITVSYTAHNRADEPPIRVVSCYECNTKWIEN